MKLIDGVYLCNRKKKRSKVVMVSRNSRLVGGRHYPDGDVKDIFKPRLRKTWKGDYELGYPPKYLLLPEEFIE